MGDLWLVRHGETEWSKSGQHTSHSDIPLTDGGERSALALQRFLGARSFALVLSSPMQRAQVTCRLAGYEPAEVIDALREWDYGAYEGLTTTQIRQQDPNWSIWTGTPPAGETAEEVGARADRVIHRAAEISGDTAVFGHGHMLRVLAARWLGLLPEAGKLLALSTASVSILGYEHEARVVNLWNQTQ